MSYMGRAWTVAAAAAVAQGRSEQGAEWHAGLRRCLQIGEKGRPLCGGGPVSSPSASPSSCAGSGDERRRQAEEAVRKAMFVSCWAPS